MHRDLLSLIFPRLFDHEQIKLFRASSVIFRSLSITKLTDTSKLTDKILNMKSVIDGRFLWENLQILKVYNNLNVTILPPALNDTLLELDAKGYSGIRDASLTNLRKLEILRVANNPNVTTLPPALNDTLLGLNAEGKSGISDEAIASLTKLQILYVDNNPKVKRFQSFKNN